MVGDSDPNREIARFRVAGDSPETQAIEHQTAYSASALYAFVQGVKPMGGHDYTVEFRIYSKTLEPSEITRDLALQPCRITVDGAVGPGGRVQGGMWAFDGAEGSIDWESLEDGLKFVLDKLWPVREIIAKYRPNGKLIWWCGNFQSSLDGGPTLSAALLWRLGEFGAELFIDNYFSRNAEELPVAP